MHPLNLPPWVVLHLPHVSTVVPDEVRGQFLIDDRELAAEIDILTDQYAVDLFPASTFGVAGVRAPVSRVVVDVERFLDDDREPAARHGFGAIYTRTTTGKPLRRQLTADERAALLERYAAHHRRLAEVVDATLREHGRCLLLDCHTFPEEPVAFEVPGSEHDRPDVCIGTDALHTPPELTSEFVLAFGEEGWDVAVNRPFAGALVPASVHGQDPRVLAIMIEVNRRICRPDTGPVDGPGHPIAQSVQRCCAAAIASFQAREREAEQAGIAAVAPQLASRLDTFEVGFSGTLRVAGYEDPTTRAEFYEYSIDGWSKSPADMAGIIKDFEPLGWAVSELYEEARAAAEEQVLDLEQELEAMQDADDDDDPEFAPDPAVMRALRDRIAERRRAFEAMPTEPSLGIGGWLRSLDQATFQDSVVPVVTSWLAEPPGLGEDDFGRGPDLTGQGCALAFFRDMDCDSLRAIGVKVVEGEHPGSSYYAATMEGCIAAANRAARSAGIPVRFVPADWVVDPGDDRFEPSTCIAPETTDAYRETHYRVDAAPPFVLRIGEASARLRELHARWDVDASVFLTACNPESRSLDEAENTRRHEALREEIDRRGLRCLEGAGQHPSNGWPPERSFLVLGVDLDEAREWGARWQQNAVVWAGADAVPRLLLLR